MNVDRRSKLRLTIMPSDRVEVNQGLNCGLQPSLVDDCELRNDQAYFSPSK